MSGPFLLIAALSGRAAATAAWRAGYAPLVADLFADVDTRAVAAGVRRVPGDVETGFDADTLLGALEDLAAQAEAPPLGFIYGAGFEDRPDILARIAARWPLLGNPPETVAAVKEPGAFAGTLARLGVPHPEIRAIDEAVPPGWLIKRQGGAGGGHVVSEDSAPHAVNPAQAGIQHPPGSCQLLDLRFRGDDMGEAAPHPVIASLIAGKKACRPLSFPRKRQSSIRRDFGRRWIPAFAGMTPWGRLIRSEGSAERRCETCNDEEAPSVSSSSRAAGLYHQRWVAGRSVSALFVSGADDTQIIGFSEQWTAPAPGQPFRFGGAARPAALADALAASLGEAVRRVARAFSLRGLNSADFIVGPLGWWLLEINPRAGATLDIFDTPGGALMQAHLAALCGGRPEPVTPAAGAQAMQVVYAPRAIRVPAMDWPEWTADRPHPGEDIPAQAPLCTILATGNRPCDARRLCLKRSNAILELMGVEECRTASAASLA